MIRRALIVVAAALVSAGTAPPASAGPEREEIRRIVVQEALRTRRVPPSLALAVAEAESDFIADAESPAGARGVMQIMPATGRGEFGVEPGGLWDPSLNVQLGVAFLARLIDRYDGRWDLALSHYNGGSRVGSGPGAKVIPSTRGYVDKVLRLERRNARDETVRRMIAAAEGVTVERLGRGAALLAEADAETRDWRPAERRQRFLDLAEQALDGAEARQRQTRADGDLAGASNLLDRIDAQRRRFRALLASLRDG